MNSTVIEILTEEASMEYFLRGLLPRILPEDYTIDVNCFIRPHEGKSDLQRSIPRKIKAYGRYGYPVKVLIVHDQDSNDCLVLKNKLVDLTQGSNLPVVIRIACRELENWYLGDLKSLAKLYPDVKASQLEGKAKYRNSDRLSGSYELDQLTKTFSKTGAARSIGSIIDIDLNRSISFQQFISGLNKLIQMS
jgi:hypothetical protein